MTEQWPDDEVQQTVAAYARRFARKYRGEVEEWEGEAWLAAVRARSTWDPARGSLDKRVRACVWHHLQERVRTLAGRNLPREPVEVESLPDRSRDVRRLLAEAGPRGRAVLSLILDPPAGRKLPTHGIKGAVVRWLLELGWAGSEILKGFAEAREVLS